MADGLNAVFKILIVKFLALKNQRIDYEYLTSGGNLFLEKIVHLETLSFRAVDGLDRFSSRRKLVNHRDVKISVECHRKCSRNRSRSHHEHVRQLPVARLSPELRTLFHSETMLLVHNREAEPSEHYIVFDERMCADDYSYRAVFKAGVYLASFCGSAASGE